MVHSVFSDAMRHVCVPVGLPVASSDIVPTYNCEEVSTLGGVHCHAVQVPVPACQAVVGREFLGLSGSVVLSGGDHVFQVLDRVLARRPGEPGEVVGSGVGVDVPASKEGGQWMNS